MNHEPDDCVARLGMADERNEPVTLTAFQAHDLVGFIDRIAEANDVLRRRLAKIANYGGCAKDRRTARAAFERLDVMEEQRQ